MSQQAMSDPEIEDGGQPLASTSGNASQVEEVGVGCPPDCAECMEQRQRCPPDCHCCMREEQNCPPDCKERLKEEARERARREMKEMGERADKIHRPWQCETQKPMTYPPDINYRYIIIDDQEIIDRLLENENLHFTERCLRYQTQDVSLENDVLCQYMAWTKSMLDAAKETGDGTRETFFQDLHDVVAEDTKIVCDEFYKLINEQHECNRQRAAQTLGIPADHGVWTNGDRLRFYGDDEWVWGWPNVERDHYRAAQRLGIPENHEEWTTEDRLRFFEGDECVRGWPNDERDRYRAAQRLGIPENHEEWTTEDRLRFFEGDECVWGWPNDERDRYRAAQRLGIPENHEEWTTEDKRRYVGSDEYRWLWAQKDDLREDLQKIDHEALACSSKDEQEAQSEKEPPAVDGEGSTKKTPDLQLDDVDNGEDEAPSPLSDSAGRLSNPEIKDEGRNTSSDSELETKTTDDLSSSPLVMKFRIERGDRYYRPLPTILIILLLNEFIKQQLHL